MTADSAAITPSSRKARPRARHTPAELRSSRHAKITGDFGEALVLYLLSKSGFECARVDHTGIDLIARNPHSGELMGISVKSRSRVKGNQTEYVSLPNENFDKAKAACEAFGCHPYFAIVVDAVDRVLVFVLTMSHLSEICPPRRRASGWKMTPAQIDEYVADPEIKTYEFHSTPLRWWDSKRGPDPAAGHTEG